MLGRFNNSQTTIIQYKVILARSRIYVISIEVVGSFKLTLSKNKICQPLPSFLRSIVADMGFVSVSLGSVL